MSRSYHLGEVWAVRKDDPTATPVKIGEVMQMTIDARDGKPEVTIRAPIFRVAQQRPAPAECECPNCRVWTIAYNDPVPSQISAAYQGPAGEEEAEEVCDLMNMAYDLAAERAARRDEADARRYRWLRAGNAYAPEEDGVQGGPALDALVDAELAGAEGS